MARHAPHSAGQMAVTFESPTERLQLVRAINARHSGGSGCEHGVNVVVVAVVLVKVVVVLDTVEVVLVAVAVVVVVVDVVTVVDVIVVVVVVVVVVDSVVVVDNVLVVNSTNCNVTLDTSSSSKRPKKRWKAYSSKDLPTLGTYHTAPPAVAISLTAEKP